jgi:hypothetical protein
MGTCLEEHAPSRLKYCSTRARRASGPATLRGETQNIICNYNSLLGGLLTLLLLAGPAHSSTSLRQMLFDAFRILEANRAILLGDGTFLSQHIWVLHFPD